MAVVPRPALAVAHGATCSWSIAHGVPTVDVGTNDLRAVAALSSTDAWAVGYSTDVVGFPHTLALHWDGVAWKVVHTPHRYEFSRFFGIVALAADDVWAAGDFYDDTAEGALIEHWDGTSWRIVNARSTDQLLGMVGLSAQDVWAVGSAYEGGYDHPFARHWNGTRWQKVEVPFAHQHGWLDAMAASSPTDVWAGGQPNLTYRWDGAGWQEVPGPGGVGLTFFNAMVALAPDDVWAIGNDGNHAFSRHWDGSAWTVPLLPERPHTRLNGAVALGTNDIWAVGSFGHERPFSASTLAMHWDGAEWSTVGTPNPPPTFRPRSLLRAVATDGSGLWAVGQHRAQGQWRTLIERCA
jgi:hypothetical protein